MYGVGASWNIRVPLWGSSDSLNWQGMATEGGSEHPFPGDKAATVNLCTKERIEGRRESEASDPSLLRLKRVTYFRTKKLARSLKVKLNPHPCVSGERGSEEVLVPFHFTGSSE
jgi:hypothetical protein